MLNQKGFVAAFGLIFALGVILVAVTSVALSKNTVSTQPVGTGSTIAQGR